MKILPATPEDLQYFGNIISYAPSPDARGIKLLDDENRVCAMVGYDNWTYNAVQMHVWIGDKKVFNRTYIRECLKYPFVQSGRKLVIGVTPGDNEEALEFNRRIGFVEKYRIVNGWDDGVDMVLQELPRDACKWLRDRGTLPATGASRPTSPSKRIVNG